MHGLKLGFLGALLVLEHGVDPDGPVVWSRANARHATATGQGAATASLRILSLDAARVDRRA